MENDDYLHSSEFIAMLEVLLKLGRSTPHDGGGADDCGDYRNPVRPTIFVVPSLIVKRCRIGSAQRVPQLQLESVSGTTTSLPKQHTASSENNACLQSGAIVTLSFPLNNKSTAIMLNATIRRYVHLEYALSLETMLPDKL